MREDIERVLDLLYFETNKVVKDIQFYERLYMEPESLECLNKSTGKAFQIFQRSLANEIMTRIFRLIDPVKTGKNENLTLMLLVVELNIDDQESGVAYELNQIRTKFKNYRNKILSHNGMSYLLSLPDEDAIQFPWNEVMTFSELAIELIILAKRQISKTDVTFGRGLNPADQLLRALNA